MTNKITLIFQPSKEAIYLGQSLGIKVKYVDDYLIPHEFIAGEFGQNKYEISTSRKFLDISCHYNTETTRHFLFKNGDSVRISLEKKYFDVEILNRISNDYECNFERYKQQDLYDDQPSALEDYYYYWHHTNNPISPISGNVISEELFFLKDKAIRQLERESDYIDSLLMIDKVSKEVAEFYKLKNVFQQDKVNLFNDSTINYSDTGIIESIVSKINNASIDSVELVSLYTYHDDFIANYYQDYLSEILGNSIDTNSIAWIEDYSSIFKKSLLFKHLDQLLSSYSIEQGQKLVESIKSDSIDDSWVDYFYTKYNLNLKFDSNWNISDNQNNTTNFKSLLLENRGRMLYVDFWASWCMASIREMSALKKLHTDYQDQLLEIVHVSVDTDADKWEWSESEYLEFNKHNSFMLNSNDLSKVRETFGINSIPRYLLFDKQGNLIHGNAPPF